VIEAEPARWNAQAASYDSSYDDPRGGRLVRARLEAAIELLGDSPGDVLDAGMGGGRLVEALAARGWRVTGADVSEAMVELARRRVPEASLVVSPVEKLPFEAGSFDAVTALGVLEFASDLDAALRELARVLRPGGRAVLSWPNFGGLYTAWRGGVLYRVARALGRPAPPPARMRLVRGEFEARLRAAGLVPERRVALSPGGRATGGLLAAQLVVAARKAP
jgi:2-polyprenyl-3-methyl-5-hydroxy-6-metoxy-1,4-benzoquinol methylase